MAYKGTFRPKFPQKYRGDSKKIIYRSLLERTFMVWLDTNPGIIEWSSEETFFIVPYYSPLDDKMHRYFPDFFIKYTDKQGKLKQVLIEVKPKSQTSAPKAKKEGTKPTRRYLKEVSTWIVNSAKWEAAEKWCEANGAQFKILTEGDIRGYTGQDPYQKKAKKVKKP